MEESWPLEDWVARLDHPDETERLRAVDAIRHLARPSESIPLFLRAFRDPYWRARALAVHALYDLSFEEDHRPLLRGVVPALIVALEDESPHVRLNAAHTLGNLGPDAIAAVPALREAAGRPEEDLGRAATEAMAAILGGPAVRGTSEG